MPSQVERVPLAEFSVTTRADEARIRDIAQRGTVAAKRSMGSSWKERSSGDGFINYAIVGPGGLVEQMAVTLRWSPAEDGAQRVTLSTGEYLTTRPTYMFIPLGPKSVPALKSLERFSDFVKGELQQRVSA